MTAYKKKLIEVALPLEAINKESLRRKQKAPKGWPTSFHKWWAQRPLAAARAVIFAQMVDDPSARPDLFTTEKKQARERERLFRIIEDLVQWENTANEAVMQAARDEIWQSWQRACAEGADCRRAKELFDSTKLPSFYDPFAGSGSLPLSAQWLGLESHASDLNPVAVLINKALIEIPPRFASKPPVNPVARGDKNLFKREWKGAQGLAEDVRYYGKWMRDEAEKRIGHLYPEIEVTAEMAMGRPDLKQYLGEKLTVIAWIWARTVKSPNPAFVKVDVPLASTFMLSTKEGKEAYVQPVIEDGGYRFTVKVGKVKDVAGVKNGTKLGRGANFRCVMSGAPMSGDYIKAEGKAGRMGARLMAVVAEGKRGRVYLAPTPDQETASRNAKPEWKPEVTISGSTQYLGVKPYGMDRFDQLFTDRQLVVLTIFSDLAGEAQERACHDATTADLQDDDRPLREGGTGAVAYAEAVSVYLACVVDRMVYYGSSLVGWLPKDSALGPSMPRQAIAMTWDFVEASALGKSSGDVITCSNVVANYLEIAAPLVSGHADQGEAQGGLDHDADLVISTDPPYYDNVPYADLSDFFYVWLRRRLKAIYPDLFATVATPKAQELVAFAYRHSGGKTGAEAFFLGGMTEAMKQLAAHAHPAFPITIYYAFKQAEDDDDSGTASTGWETFLAAVLAAGLSVTGTWPLRTEGEGRMRGMGSNVLASSIVLVCRPRSADAPVLTHRDFQRILKAELPVALKQLQRGNIAPVDLAQAAIGPGMAIFTRYARVLEKDDSPMTVRTALTMINRALDEVLVEQEGEFEPDTRWALAWFDQFGFDEGPFGVAEALSKAKVTSVAGLIDAGILKSRGGRARLLRREELDSDWDPAEDARLTVWESVHYLIRALEKHGESAAATLLKSLPTEVADACRDLAYRLYVTCERRKWAKEAGAYNGLVIAWPQILRLSAERRGAPDKQQKFEL